MEREFDLLPLLDHIDPSILSYQEWINVGFALKHEGYTASDWDNWSLRDPARYRKSECFKKWDTFNEEAGSIVTGGTIVQLAKDHGWVNPYSSDSEGAHELDWNDTIDRDYRVIDKNWIEAICDYFGISDVELLGSEMKVRTFAYYKDDTLLAFGTMEEIAEQTGRKIESLRSLLCNSKRFNKTTKTYMIELEDDRRYKLKFKQSFTIDELNLKGIGWLLESPLVEVEEVEE